MNLRKGLTALLFLISLLGLAAAVWMRRDGVYLSGCRVTAEEAAALRAGREETDLRLVKQLFFAGYPLFSDESVNSFYYSLVENDPSSFDPAVRWEGNSRRVRVVLTEGELTPENITGNVPLRILAYDDQYYREYAVYCTTLPLLRIDSEIEFIHGNGKDRDLKMILFDNRTDARQRLIRMDGVIHVRGNVSTTVYPKQAYKMTLFQQSPGKHEREADLSLLGMRTDGEWILYAGYNDQERIRNVFSSVLWFQSCAGDNEFGIRNGNEYRFVELFMNGKYWGLYALGTPLDAKQMEPLRQTEQVDHVFVFKKSFWKPEYSDLPEELLMRDYEIKGEDTRANEETARAMLQDYDNWVLQGASGAASEVYGVRADMGNAIDTWLFVNLVQGMDTVASDGSFVNMFLTLVQTGEETVVIYTPWDLDLTWGNLRRGGIRNSTRPYGIGPENHTYVMLRNPANRLAETEPDLIAERYWKLRSGPWSDAVVQELIAGYETDIFDSGAYLRDIAKWPKSTQEDPALGLSVFSDYAASRFAEMDRFVEGLEY